MDDKELFKSMIAEYMLRRYEEFESDKLSVFNKVSLHCLSSDDYYSMLVTEVQEATAKSIFRDIKQIIKTYL